MGCRVLHCYADHKWTGPSGPVVRLCRELTERGCHSEIACMWSPPDTPNELADRAGEFGLRTHPIFHPKKGINPIRFLRDRARLREVTRGRHFDLIHCHGSRSHFVIGWRRHASSYAEKPVVRTDHAARHYEGQLPVRLYYGPRVVDHLVVLADRFRAQAIDRLRRDPATVTTIRGAVNADTYAPIKCTAQKRAELGFGGEDVIIGIVARVQYHRRFEVVLEAAHILRERNARVKIAVCGRGTHRKEILDRPVVEQGLEDTVFPLGYRTDDYREVLAVFDAGLMLVPGSDGSCRAAMEMCAMEKPLVVARRGVLPEIVRDGETGIVIDDTPENLAAALLEVAADPVLRAEWGRAARQRMLHLFNPARQAEQYSALYESLLA